MPPPGIH